MTDERDPYKLLGVPVDASDEVIRRAYHGLARRAHPDLVGAGGLTNMQMLNWAWALLKDPERRGDYDTSHGLPGARAKAGQAAPEPATAPGPAKESGFGGQPSWTGAAGRPPGRPFGPVLDFGIYAGWSIGEIGRRDRGYLIWLRDRVEARAIRTDVERLLGSTAGENPAASKDQRTGQRRR